MRFDPAFIVLTLFNDYLSKSACSFLMYVLVESMHPQQEFQILPISNFQYQMVGILVANVDLTVNVLVIPVRVLNLGLVF